MYRQRALSGARVTTNPRTPSGHRFGCDRRAALPSISLSPCHLVQAACFAINTSKNFSTNFSPFALMYGFEPHTPVSLLTCLPQSVSPTDKLQTHFAMRTEAHRHLTLAQNRQKRLYDKTRGKTTYKKGQKVLVFRKSQKHAAKFRYSWHLGRVKEQSGPSSYLVQVRLHSSLRLQKYHIHHMKPFVSRPEALRLPPPAPQVPCLSVSLAPPPGDRPSHSLRPTALPCRADTPLAPPRPTSTTTSPSPQTLLRFCTWNVCSFRALIRKPEIELLETSQFDIICLQETKASPAVLASFFNPLGFHTFTLPSSQLGYAGVAIATRIAPLTTIYGLNDASLDSEGRVITLKYDNFNVISAYAPFSGKFFEKLEKRLAWCSKFRALVSDILSTGLPLILAADLNVAETDADVSPALPHNVAGTSLAERSEHSQLLSLGLADAFRSLHPTLRDHFSFWSYGHNNRSRNIGLRFDYFLISRNHVQSLKSCSIRSDILGSDHAPVVASFSL